MKFHNELNPKLWDKNNEEYTLKEEVKAKLEEIATAFIEYLDIPADAILDKVITGSSASYNYTEFSDLDLHIIVDFDKVHKDCPVVEGYLSAMKSTFNKEHDIFIHGVPVELYAEKKDQGTVHNGLYSLQTGWIDIPNKIEPTDNDAAVEAKYNELKELIDKCETAEVADELLDKIYTMRKAGLADAGEFSTENLAFKKLRNEGVMNKLRQLKKQEVDKQLSLESYNEAEDLPRGMKTKINKAYKALIEATKEIQKWCYGRGRIGPRLTHKYSTPTEKVCYLWHGKFNMGFCDCIVTIDWSTGDIIYNIETGSRAKVKKKETLQTKDLQEFIAWFKEVFDYEYQNLWDDETESIKESLKDEYKQAFDLLVEGENIVATLDTDFGKQFVKDVENLYKIKSYRLKLSIAKEMLKDIQGYLVDEQYDNYNAKIDKFINNSKNESIKEEFFVGNDKYIIVPVSYAYNDIRILDKKTGEFLKNENGDILKFATEEECGNYIKSLEGSIKEAYEWHGPVAKVTFDNGDVIETEINGTDEEIKSYYMGKTFNLGREEDDMHKVVKVEVIRESVEDVHSNFKSMAKRIVRDFKVKGYPKSNKFYMDFAKEAVEGFKKDWGHNVKISTGNGELILTLEDTYQAVIDAQTHKVKFSDLENSNYMFENETMGEIKMEHKNESIKEDTYMDKDKSMYDKATELAQDRAKIDFVSKMNPQDLVNYAVKAIKRNDANISDVENMLNKANYTPGQIEDILDMVRTNLDEDCATLEKKMDLVQDDLNAMIRDLSYVDEDTILESLKNSIKEALN